MAYYSCPICYEPCATLKEAQNHCIGKIHGSSYTCAVCGTKYHTLYEMQHCAKCRQRGTTVCPVCKGTRFKNGRICHECNGTGKVLF